MKIRSGDCIDLLRRFGIAPDSSVSRDIDRLEVSHPDPTNTMAVFRYHKRTYVLLIDDDAADDAEYVYDVVARALPGRNATLVENPQDSAKIYALPYEAKSIYLLAIDADKQRLDSYLADTRPELSRSSWQKQIKRGLVNVDGQVQTSPKALIDSYSDINVTSQDVPMHDDRELPIIYIDDDVIIIDKPVGVLTHSKNQLDVEFTVADFFRRYTAHGLDTDRPGIVHRLDRDTSGVVIGARTPEAYDHLKKQFADREVSKIYTAVVQGIVAQDELRIDLPIARNTTKPGSFTVKADGKPAQTHLRVIQRGDNRTLLELQPRTGRTHQLRVHLAHLGHPIVGDRFYGTAADRLYLHATQLMLELPSGERKTFDAAVPDGFSGAVDAS